MDPKWGIIIKMFILNNTNTNTNRSIVIPVIPAVHSIPSNDYSNDYSHKIMDYIFCNKHEFVKEDIYLEMMNYIHQCYSIDSSQGMVLSYIKRNKERIPEKVYNGLIEISYTNVVNIINQQEPGQQSKTMNVITMLISTLFICFTWPFFLVSSIVFHIVKISKVLLIFAVGFGLGYGIITLRKLS